MTREEAVGWLKNEKWTNANNKYKKEWNEAFDLAIEALKGGDAEMLNEDFRPKYMQQSRHDDGRMTREEAIKIIDCYDIGFYDLSGEKIPADKLANAFDMAIDALQAVPNCQKCAIKELWEETEKEDLVAVVRCKDCKWRKFIDWGMGDCLHPKGSKHIAYDNHYCSYGERREK